MGKIIISANSSLDGIAQDPDGKEGSELGGWFDQSVGADRAAWAENLVAEAQHAEALLLGRTSDEWFAERWLPRTGAYADRLNAMPKYVVSRSAEHAAWSNATLLGGDMPDEIAKLKREIDGEIVVYGSFQLGHALMEADLVDQIRVAVLPVVVGEGVRLFSRTGGMGAIGGVGGIKVLRHLDTKTLGRGIVFSSYEVAGKR